MEQYPQILEPLLFYILPRANHVLADRAITHVFKAFFIDEAWTFFRNPRNQGLYRRSPQDLAQQNAA